MAKKPKTGGPLYASKDAMDKANKKKKTPSTPTKTSPYAKENKKVQTARDARRERKGPGFQFGDEGLTKRQTKRLVYLAGHPGSGGAAKKSSSGGSAGSYSTGGGTSTGSSSGGSSSSGGMTTHGPTDVDTSGSGVRPPVPSDTPQPAPAPGIRSPWGGANSPRLPSLLENYPGVSGASQGQKPAAGFEQEDPLDEDYVPKP